MGLSAESSLPARAMAEIDVRITMTKGLGDNLTINAVLFFLFSVTLELEIVPTLIFGTHVIVLCTYVVEE